MKKIFSIAVILCAGLSFTACHDGIVIDKVDESYYDNVTNLYVTARDGQTGKISTVVDMYKETYSTNVCVSLPRVPRKGVDIKLEYDADYLTSYNAEHQTDFALLPKDQFYLHNDGKIVVAPDQKTSFSLPLEIDPFEDTEEATYLLPLKVVSNTEGVRIPESASHLIYLVKNFSGRSAVERKEGEKKFIAWIETNHTNPLNFLLLETEDGRLLTDYLVLFAFNINYNKETGEIYVSTNQQDTFILNNYETVIRPLQERGMKVAISILGNHDESGLAQLSDLGCREFARKVAAIVNSYGFDGVNFDDEYSNSPDLTNPLFAPRSYAQGNRLYYETKKLLPDKDMICYQYGYALGNAPVDGVDPSEYMDIFNGDYNVKAVPYGESSLSTCSYQSSEFALLRGMPTESSVQNFVNSEYGWWMGFSMWSNPGNERCWNYMNIIAKGMLGSPLKKPTYFYTDCVSMTTAEINW